MRVHTHVVCVLCSVRCVCHQLCACMLLLCCVFGVVCLYACVLLLYSYDVLHVVLCMYVACPTCVRGLYIVVVMLYEVCVCATNMWRICVIVLLCL